MAYQLKKAIYLCNWLEWNNVKMWIEKWTDLEAWSRTNVGIPESVSGENASQRSNAKFALEGSVLWEGPVEVSLDLVRREVFLSACLSHDAGVVAWVSHHLSGREV